MSKQTNTPAAIKWMALVLNIIILKAAYVYHDNWYWALVVSGPLLIAAVKRKW